MSAVTGDPGPLMLVRDAAPLLSMNEDTAYRRAKAGTFPVETFPSGRKIMCRRADVYRIAYGETTTAPEPEPVETPAAVTDRAVTLRSWQARLRQTIALSELQIAEIDQELLTLGG